MFVFSTDQLFKTRDDLKKWVQNIARANSYIIVTKRSKTKPSGNVSKVVLMCDRGGTYRPIKDLSRATGSKKINCPFQLVGKYTKRHDYWTLSVIRDEHNHPPAKYLEGHPFAKRLLDDEFQLVAELTKKHVAPRDILGIVKEQNKDNVSTLKTIYNARHKIREMDHKGQTPMHILLSLLRDNGYIFKYSTNSLSNELEALFFVHQASYALLRAFPHVLLMDATYKTNKYNMPFLEIVGVTSTNKTFSIAFSCMNKEKEENYTWILSTLQSTLDDCLQPRVIVTDRELALMNACKQVFPNSTRLLCRWHISQNIFKRWRKSITSQRAWDSFTSKWDALINSQMQQAFTENYKQLQAMMSTYPGVFDYLDDSWLNKYKEMFVSYWIDQCLHFGNRTTNRVGSQHGKLKKYLRSSNSTLDRFVGLVDDTVKSQYTSIKESFEKSIISQMHHHNLPCLKLLHGHVSHEALDIIVEEIKLNPFDCCCQVRKCYGLPCACEMYLNGGQYIHLDSIDIFWRKLDMLPLTHEENDDITCDVELQRFHEVFQNQSKHGKKILLEKLKEILDPSLPSVEEPVVQKNTRGRPNLKKKERRRTDPLTPKPRKRSSQNTPNVVEFDFMGLTSSPSTHGSFTTYSSSLMKEIPDIFHPYITHIQNVKGGHCGFRSTSVALGYDEDRWPEIRHLLLEELYQAQDQYKHVFSGGDFDSMTRSLDFVGTGGASPINRMIMPDTSVLIANKFGVIVIFLSKRGSSTCFPFWRRPEELQNHHVLTLAHVYGNHYVMVRLEGDYPMPHVIPLWTHYKNSDVAGWLTMYKPCLDMYDELFRSVSKNIPNIVIDI